MKLFSSRQRFSKEPNTDSGNHSGTILHKNQMLIPETIQSHIIDDFRVKSYWKIDCHTIMNHQKWFFIMLYHRILFFDDYCKKIKKNFLLTPIWDILGISLGGIYGQNSNWSDDVTHVRKFFSAYHFETTRVPLHLCHSNVPRDFIIGDIIINFSENMGIEWASFVIEKSTCVWECQEASFVDKKSMANIYIEF